MSAADPRDRALARLLDEARADLAADLAAERDRLIPDFLAVLEEARARGQHLAEIDLAEIDPTEGLDHRDLRTDATTTADPTTADLALDTLLADARRLVEADRAARALLGVPPLPARAPAAAPRRVAWLLGAALACAAAVVLALALRPLLSQRIAAGPAAPSEAAWQGPPDGPDGRAALRPGAPLARAALPARPAPPRAELAPAGAAAEPFDDPAEAATICSIDHALSDITQENESDGDRRSTAALDPRERPADAADAAPAATSAPVPFDSPQPAALDPRAPRPTPAPDRPAPAADPLAALEAEAEALWRAGDLPAASERLHQVIRRARDPRRVDLAYGDLLAITRQLAGRDAEAALWPDYLRRLPRGRYADDARAGLCRRAPAADAPACWRRYLADFPRGAHQGEATRRADAPP